MNTIRRILCAVWGHSRIQSGFFGYWYCGRCETQVGDSLGSSYDARGVVLIGHNCEKCRDTYKTLSFWRDKLLTRNPFEAQP